MKNPVATQNMKIKLKNLKSNNYGFAILITLILLPLLTLILYAVANVVIVTAFKAEYKFICIEESLKLQAKLLQFLPTASHRNKSNVDSFNNLSQQGAFYITEKLKKIKTSVQYNILNSTYPKIESNNQVFTSHKLAFNLDYTFINKYHVECGVNLIKENNLWKSEIIY